MNKLKDIRIDKIDIDKNSRLRIEDKDVSELMNDIKQRGLLQPIGVIQKGNRYLYRYGARRILACKKLGWKTIKAEISTDQDNPNIEDNIAENIHRKDLTPFEFANVCKNLLNSGLNKGEISARLNVSVSRITKALDLLRSLPNELKSGVSFRQEGQKQLKDGAISMTVLSTIMQMRGANKVKKELIHYAKQEELSVGELNLIKLLLDAGNTLPQAINKRKLYSRISVSLCFKTSELKKYKGSRSKMLYGFISGKNKPNKKLLV